ncbi:MAG: hypothetical protein Q4E37_01465 [Tissierellia bacterium]|nr:hypothetical protein [Tissierellia bacterium]
MLKNQIYLHIFTTGYIPGKDFSFAYAWKKPASQDLQVHYILKKEDQDLLRKKLEDLLVEVWDLKIKVYMFNPLISLRLAKLKTLDPGQVYRDRILDLYRLLRDRPSEKTLPNQRLETYARAGGRDLTLIPSEKIYQALGTKEDPEAYIKAQAKTYLEALEASQAYLKKLEKALTFSHEPLRGQINKISSKENYTIIEGQKIPSNPYYAHKSNYTYQENKDGLFQLGLETIPAAYDPHQEGLFYRLDAKDPPTPYNPLPMPKGYLILRLGQTWNIQGIKDLIGLIYKDLDLI